MIENYEQPKKIVISDTLELIRYYPYYRRTLPWYQDLTLCKQVDNIDHPYDMDRLRRMYTYLSTKGECYYIKYKDGNTWHLVGDISLCGGAVSIVIAPEYQNRHIGRAAITGICRRAKEIGLPHLDAEIYAFNAQSRRAFEAMGFREIAPEQFRLNL